MAIQTPEGGRKAYTLSVGRVSATKLANFPEIECFVLVASPEDTLVDDREFNVPVITPLELEVTMNSFCRLPS